MLRLGRWLLIGLATALVTAASAAAGVPADALFAGLLVGLVYALASGVPLAPARPAVVAAQVGIGVALGTYFQPVSYTHLTLPTTPYV